MPTTYERCDESVTERVRRMIEEYHHRLAQSGVRIDLLFARRDDALPAVIRYGIPALAITRVVGLKDRAKGCGDAEIVIDERRWGELADEQADAVVDHELTHLEPTGKTDDLHRPKIVIRPHDIETGWFVGVARRHGEASLEVRQAREIAGKYGQLLFGFADAELAAAE